MPMEVLVGLLVVIDILIFLGDMSAMPRSQKHTVNKTAILQEA